MKQILKYLIISLLCLFLLIIVGGGAWLYLRARASLPQLDGTIQVTELSAPVEVLRDARGVPHLRASSLQDLFFAQGYVTAQDRLWQMDLSRRLAEGSGKLLSAPWQSSAPRRAHDSRRMPTGSTLSSPAMGIACP
jgi:penicillin amidase